MKGQSNPLPPKDPDRKCNARRRGGPGYCQRPAGWGTDHPGVGRCKLHGGDVPVSHGLYSKYSRHRLAELAAKFREDPDLLNLRDTIALQAALVTDLLSQQESAPGIDPEMASLLATLTERIGRNIERLHKLEVGERYILEVSDVQRIIGQVTAVLQEEIDDPALLHRIGERLGGLKL